jgi:hypothetical protein
MVPTLFRQASSSCDRAPPTRRVRLLRQQARRVLGRGGTLTYIQWQAEKRKRMRNPEKAKLPEITDAQLKEWNESPTGGGKRRP